MNKIIENFKDKKVALLGFGMEGKSTYRYIRKYIPNQMLYIIDTKDIYETNSYLKDDNNITYVKYDSSINYMDYDLIMKSPGISLNDIDITPFRDKISSQYDILVNNYRNNIIGITGTKGKSTTSSLIYNVLKNNNINTYLVGNIGIPMFDYLDDIKDDTMLVVELSAYQLEYPKVSPKYSIVLNLFEEHLDYFKELNKYYNAKLNIARYQTNDDYFLYSSDNNELNNRVNNLDIKSHKINITRNNITDNSIYCDDNYVYYINNNNNNKIKIYNINDRRYLLGDHNLTDIMFVLGIASILNLDNNKTVEAINNFKGLEHRLEYVGEYNNIKYYDDAIATIPEATINAIRTLKDVDTLIIGGKDRGIDYSQLIDYLKESNISNIICMPDSGYKIADKLNKNTIKIETLEQAVRYAKKNTKKGMICVLSPSAPSYNCYKNFEEKGNRFKELVRNGE